MCGKGDYSPEDRVRVYEFLIRLFDLLYPDGNCGFYHVRYAEIYRGMAACYLKLKDEAKMFECLEKAADHAVAYDTARDGKYTSFMVNRVEYRAADAVQDFSENESGLLLKTLRSDKYKRYANDPHIVRIVEKLKTVADM